MSSPHSAPSRGNDLSSAFADNSPDCVKVLDAEGRLLWMNDRGRHLMDAGDPAPLIGASWADFWSGSHRRAAKSALEAARAGEVGRFCGECVTLAGRARWWDVIVTAIEGDADSRGFLAISRDVTEFVSAAHDRDACLARERAVRLEAEKTARARERALLLVSHELRAPLNAVRGWASLLTCGASPEESAKGLAAIVDNAGRLSALVEQLVDAAQYQRAAAIAPVPNSIASLVDAAIASVAPSARAKRLSIRHRTMPGWVMADFMPVQQAISNLLFNAVKFTPEGGAVEVRCVSAGDLVRVAVIDTGAGVSADLLPRLFQPFTQSPFRSGGGLGLGLSITRAIAEAHGGSVEASSAGEGRGSTFSLLLPKANDPLVA
ncbi:MAG: PAS domain-containing sensor histidine kinase [Acidobacteriota bacterium]|nr:PAS domain-containing sensor histidine kinase [Acidobacteriota bacterium]